VKRYTDKELLALLEDLESDGRKPQDFIPGARIQFLRIDGTQWGDEVIDELRMDGSFSRQIQALDQKMTAHNRVAVDIVSAPTEIRRYDYPIPALQQLTRNAVMHRSYEGANAPVMVYWFDDHMEIINADGPYGRVTPENFGKPGFADYRNPDIAESMKVLNLVQRFGVGIQMARRKLSENGNPPPEFIFDTHSVICKVYPAPLPEALITEHVPGQAAPQAAPSVTPQVKKLLHLLTTEMDRQQILHALGLKVRKNLRVTYLEPSLKQGLVEMTQPDSPNSPTQKYRLTPKGRKWLKENRS
jgi:predicted HTH transcriptional regulator